MLASAVAATQGDPSVLSVVAPVAAGLVGGIAVGWFGHAGLIKSTRITSEVEREKLAHEQDKYYAERRDAASEDYNAAAVAMEMLAIEDVDLEARRTRAQKARKHLLGASWTLGRPISGTDEELIRLLGDPNEENLRKARELWPEVSQALAVAPAPPRARA